ncbi:MAG: TPM domain-containing protein [Nitrospinae bacterium]|nr:TPM domain-containing protein [Nitrospinota bacterium]
MKHALFLALLLTFASPAMADMAIPPLKSPVTDVGGILTRAQRDELNRTLKDFERRKGSQLAVLTVPTTKPETIEQYSIRVMEKWKLGRKGINDGVLLLVAAQDRTLRIEVGYGLEGALPDAIAKRITSEIIVPRFKQGDFGGGVIEGTRAIMQAASGENLPAPQPRHATGTQGDDDMFWFLALSVGVPILFIILSVFKFTRHVRRRPGAISRRGLGSDNSTTYTSFPDSGSSSGDSGGSSGGDSFSGGGGESGGGGSSDSW